jgi:hypothetical protein
MNKSNFLIITSLLALTACADFSDEFKEQWHSTYQGICRNPDAIQYPSPWTKEASEKFVISDKKIRSMSTCGLVETWYTHPERVAGPWCAICSNLNIPGVTLFNDQIAEDKVLVELFSRADCILVLAAKYREIIDQEKEKAGRELSLDVLLSSNIFISMLSGEDRILFMEMALEMKERPIPGINETRHLMVAIMKACNYIPFMKYAEEYVFDGQYGYPAEVQNGFVECLHGYRICESDKVEQYAEEFMNTLK